MIQKNTSDPARTMLVISAGFLLIFVVTQGPWALYVSLAVALTGIFSTWLSLKVEWLWMKLAWLLGLVVPNIVLTLIFFLVLCPVAFLSRLFGEKDPLILKNRLKSTFREVNKTFEKESFEKMW